MSGRRSRAERQSSPRRSAAEKRWGVVRVEGGIVLAKNLTREQAERLVAECHRGPISGTWEARDLSDTHLVKLDLRMPAP